jgi:hypothetical protein
MGGGGVFKKTDSGFGAGVRPTAGLMNSRDNLISQGRGASWENPNARSVNPHGMSNVTGGSMGVNAAGSSTSGARWGGLIEDGGVTDAWSSPNFVHGDAGKRFQERYGMEHFNTNMPMDKVNDKPSYGGTRTPSNPYNTTDVSEAQGIHDRAEERRQEKLDAMAGMAQGKGGGGGGVSGQIVGDGGDLNIQHTSMERGKDGFPTLADFEQPLHPFMGKRKLNLKGYA